MDVIIGLWCGSVGVILIVVVLLKGRAYGHDVSLDRFTRAGAERRMPTRPANPWAYTGARLTPDEHLWETEPPLSPAELERIRGRR